jgi:hypothetical protein
MNQLDIAKRAQIIAALVEGNSMGATARIAGVAFNTVLKLLPEIGQTCEDYQKRVLRDLPCRRIECDGIFGFGDVWTWVALCADTKLVPSWAIGGRDAATA